MKQQALLLIVLPIASALGCLAGSAHAQAPAGANTVVVKETAPGKGAAARVTKVVATVEAIDVQKRQLDLKGPKGNVVSLVAGPEVRNLDQIKVGDQVNVAYAEALTLELKKDGKELRSRVDSVDSARAASGARPAGIVAEQTKVVADVMGVDTRTQLVTLRGPKRVVELYVADPEQLKLIKIGDQVEATYTQALAVSVEPVAPAKK